MFFATPLLELITITLASGLVYIKGKSQTNLQYPHMQPAISVYLLYD